MFRNGVRFIAAFLKIRHLQNTENSSAINFRLMLLKMNQVLLETMLTLPLVQNLLQYRNYTVALDL